MNKGFLSIGAITIGTLAACTPVGYTEVIVDSPPPIVYRSAPAIYVTPTYTPVYRPHIGRYYAPYSSYRRHSPYWHRPGLVSPYRHYRR